MQTEPEPFTLQPSAPERKPLVVSAPLATRQGKLFAGADCLAGQTQLFPSDGPREAGRMVQP